MQVEGWGRGERIAEEIDRSQARIGAEQRRQLKLIARYESTGSWEHDGAADMAQWLSARLGMSRWAASRRVTAARALADLPRIAAALDSGALPLEKVVELTRYATPETEKKLITWARRVSVSAIKEKADLAQREERDELKAAEESRYLRWWWFDDGKRLGLFGEFPAAQGAVIAKSLERMADKIPDLPQEELAPGIPLSDEYLVEQRRADALFCFCSREIREDQDPDLATVVVHTTLDSLGIHPAGASIQRGPAIDPETSRRLSCDGRLQFVLSDHEGNALGIGRTSRLVPEWLRRQLIYRDHHCTFPGCARRTFLQAHHIWHWEHGGPTDLDNLVLTCHFHHKLVHEFGWDVRLDGSNVKWLRPGGAVFDPGPDPPADPVPDNEPSNTPQVLELAAV